MEKQIIFAKDENSFGLCPKLKTTTVEESLCGKVEQTSHDLNDLGIEHKIEQLLIRNAKEYLLIREFRAMSLDKMQREAEESLKPLRNNNTN